MSPNTPPALTALFACPNPFRPFFIFPFLLNACSRYADLLKGMLWYDIPHLLFIVLWLNALNMTAKNDICSFLTCSLGLKKKKKSYKAKPARSKAFLALSQYIYCCCNHGKRHFSDLKVVLFILYFHFITPSYWFLRDTATSKRSARPASRPWARTASCAARTTWTSTAAAP